MNHRDMIVDLTPLLDVILILLFMVLASQTETNEETIQALQDEVVQLEQTQLPQTPSEVSWMRTYQEEIGKVNIVFPSSLSDERMYLVLENGQESYKNDTEDLDAWLEKQISTIDDDVVIVTFSYDSEEIYNTEYRNVVSAITLLDQELEQTIVYREEEMD